MDGDTGDGGFFMDSNVAAGLNTAVPVVADIVVLEANVGTAGGTECRTGFTRCPMLFVALEALDLTSWNLGLEESCACSSFAYEFRGGWDGSWTSFGCGLVGFSVSGDRADGLVS